MKRSQRPFSAGVTNFASYLERSLDTRVNIYNGKMDYDIDATSFAQRNETDRDLSAGLAGVNRRRLLMGNARLWLLRRDSEWA